MRKLEMFAFAVYCIERKSLCNFTLKKSHSFFCVCIGRCLVTNSLSLGVHSRKNQRAEGFPFHRTD